MTDRDSFAELQRKRNQLDRDVQDIIVAADQASERLRAATATVAAPSAIDHRSRGRKGPSNPTLGAQVARDDYATTQRGAWHRLALGHPPTVPDGEPRPHRCPDLQDLFDRGHLDTECLAGMAARAGVELDHCRHRHLDCPRCRVPVETCRHRGAPCRRCGGLTGVEHHDTVHLTNALQDTWHLLFTSREPDVLLLGTLARDLGRARRRMQDLAADLLLWSDDRHPAAGRHPDPCRCDGDLDCACRGDCDKIPNGRMCSRCRTHRSRARRRLDQEAS